MASFLIQTKINGALASEETFDVAGAANAIEDWQSQFTDLPRTRYGMKITTEYVEALKVGEFQSYEQKPSGTRHQFLITRQA